MNEAKPLEGLKVLDFSAVISGAYCTHMMADLGAEIFNRVQPSDLPEVCTRILRSSGPDVAIEAHVICKDTWISDGCEFACNKLHSGYVSDRFLWGQDRLQAGI